MAWSRESRQSRGYGADWDRTRLRVLRRDSYLCQCSHCKAAGRVTAASQVDHVVSKARARRMGWTAAQIDADANLAAISKTCHERKTIEEKGARPRPRIGIDGFPVGT